VSAYKIGGCCSICDEPVFQITAVWEEGTTRAGEPKALGMPNEGATSIAFLLASGGYTTMTFCGKCAESLNVEHYTLLWRKNLAGYMREQNGDPSKFADQFTNILLCELGRKQLRDMANG
jgi:hypothetical protein